MCTEKTLGIQLRNQDLEINQNTSFAFDIFVFDSKMLNPFIRHRTFTVVISVCYLPSISSGIC